MPKWLTLILCLVIPMATGFTSGLLTRSESSGPWYQSIQKPPFNPPGWVFGPVWTSLYLLMGVSLYLVIQAGPSPWRQPALVVFAVQLVLNFAWSLIFFRMHRPGLAAVDILPLLTAIVAMVVLFYRITPLAAWLQIPYLLWVTFATVLNLSIYWLNRPAG